MPTLKAQVQIPNKVEVEKLIPGPPGFSPTIEIGTIEEGLRLTITDVNGTNSYVVQNGAQGPAGSDYVLTEEDKQEIAGMVELYP